MVASYEIVGLSNIVTTFLPPFVHIAWDELNHKNPRQLRSLASHDFPEKKDSLILSGFRLKNLINP